MNRATSSGQTNRRSECGAGRRRAALRARRYAYRGYLMWPEETPDQGGGKHAHRLAELARERDHTRDAYLRARAEMDNMRKRLEREMDESNRRAVSEILSEMVHVLDNFDRAIEAARAAEDGQAVLQGIFMIREMMSQSLANRGLERLEAEGAVFDPQIHEAVAVDALEDTEDNRVTAVLQNGYLYRGRLLRPAMVRVNKKPKA